MRAETYFPKAYGYRAYNKFKDKHSGNVHMIELKTLVFLWESMLY